MNVVLPAEIRASKMGDAEREAQRRIMKDEVAVRERIEFCFF